MTTPYSEQTQGGWYQFDPNVHYYYDEQGQLHYYDPNTNLEYDYQPQYQQQQQQQPNAYYQQQLAYTNTSTPQSYTQPQSQHLDSSISISRQGTPDVLLPCPDPNCNGENKPTSKFCEECGRSLGAISRSTTPGIVNTPNTMSSLTRAFSNHQIRDKQTDPMNGYPPPQRPPTAPIYSSSPLDSVHTVPLYHPPSAGSAVAHSSHLYYNNAQHQSMQDIYGMRQENNAYYYQQPAVDPLDRARGCPIVSFGFGGKMLVTFPRTVANYYASTVKPQPGPIKIKSLKEYDRSSPSNAFPVLLDPKVGIKQKKKDVAHYLNMMVDEYEKQKLAVGYDSFEFHQLQAKIVLYQIVKVLVETDGKINDKDKMDRAILQVLRPTMKGVDDTHFALPAYQGGQPDNSNTDLSDYVLTKIENYLLNGDRKGAVEYAIQEDLWGHALIISSCVDKELWQRVIQNFVDREVNCTPEMRQNRTFHNVAGNNQALRVIYSLFSGAGASAMKEFLKVDTQYINTAYGQQAITPKVELSQLTKWRETLAIILANRTARDLEALTAFGDIMRDQGWIEAAHICYLLSPQSSIHSGIDTVQARLTLVGGTCPTLEAICLSEIFEFAYSLQHNSSCLPFLQGYKLARAWTLADFGHIDLAQRYYSAIDQAIKTYTKPSPYLHAYLQDQVNQFGLFLQNIHGKKNGVDGSWLKPKFPKNGLSSLWGSLEGSLTKFVSGEEVPVQEAAPRKSTEIMARYT